MLNMQPPTYDRGARPLTFSPYRQFNESGTASRRPTGRSTMCNSNYKDATRPVHHAFRKIWKCNQFPAEACPQGRATKQSKSPLMIGPEPVRITWKQWPPPVVPVPTGLKIPVKLTPDLVDPCHDYTHDPNFLMGEDEIISAMEYQPQEEMTLETCLKGVLNTHESESFSVQPSTATFINPVAGQSYTMVLKVRNNGCCPRRMGVINPKSTCFDIDWGASIGERTLLAPGLSNRIIIRFRPTLTTESVHDMLTVIIDDDGAIVIPVVARSASSPILEMEEWDVGCSTVGNARIANFEVINRGGEGRFWLLTEEEFLNEYIELHGPRRASFDEDTETMEGCEREYCTMYGEDDGEGCETSNDLHKDQKQAILNCQKKALREKLMRKLDHLICHPFRIYPACFRLQRNQIITIQSRYRPKNPSYHMRKLALLCDTGEVKWIALKGVGIDPIRFPLVEFKGEWKAPPIDLPMDLSARISIDCGDILAGEKKSQCFTVYNNSCMPLYFFWCVRHQHTGVGSLRGGHSYMLEHKRTIDGPNEWHDYESEIADGIAAETDPIKVFPSQGILNGRESIQVCVSIQAPYAEGYHTSVLSFFAEQLGDQSEGILAPHVELFNEVCANEDPVTYEKLIQVLPPKVLDVETKLANTSLGKSKQDTGRVGSVEKPTLPNNNGSGDAPSSDRHTVTTAGRRNTSLSGRSTHSTNKQGGSSVKRFLFPPMPVYFVQEDSNNNDSEYELELVRLEYPPHLLSTRRFRKLIDWNDGDSNNGANREEEGVYREYFGKVCTVDGKPVLESTAILQDDFRSSGGAAGDGMVSPLLQISEPWEDNYPEDNDLNDDDDPLELRYGPQYARRPLTSNSEDVREMQLKQREELRLQGCRLASYAEKGKFWLDDSSPLQPVQELEVWFQVVPLQCKFEPAFISAYGDYSERVTREISFFNNSHHSVCLTLDPIVTEVGSIICWPYEATVQPSSHIDIQFKFQFRRKGVREGHLRGSLRLPYTDETVPIKLPYRIQADGPEVITLTPLLDFGLVYPSDERVQTLVLKNCGRLRTKWTAAIPEESTEDEDAQQLSYPGSQLKNSKIIRAWPQWGTIEPGETVAVQIYLSSACSRKLSTTCEITIEENPDEKLFVGIMAELMYPKVILRDVRLVLTEAFKGMPNYELTATLQNLTAFPTAFRWCDPVGDQGKYISLKTWPQEGILPPKGLKTCQFEFLASAGMVLTNAFVPCCIAGLREPLIAKLEGTVFSLCLKIVIPRTKLTRVKQEDIPWDCMDDIWPYICGLDEEELGEEHQKSPYVSYLGAYGKYCRVPVFTPPPPPTATQTQTKLVDETEEDQEEQEVETLPAKSNADVKRKKQRKGKDHHRREKTAASTPKSARSAKSLKKLGKKMKGQLEQVEENETEEEEETVMGDETEAELESDFLPEDAYAEEEDPNTISSGARMIYFQVMKWGQIASAKFHVYNDSRLNTRFKFQVLQNPAINDELEPEGQRFVVLDDAFFDAMKNVYAEKVSLLRGKKGCVFNVYPSEGVLSSGSALEITVEFLANTYGIYEDVLECRFEGLDDTYTISLVGLAVICNRCPVAVPVDEIRPESPVELCVRKLNPLLH